MLPSGEACLSVAKRDKSTSTREPSPLLSQPYICEHQRDLVINHVDKYQCQFLCAIYLHGLRDNNGERGWEEGLCLLPWQMAPASGAAPPSTKPLEPSASFSGATPTSTLGLPWPCWPVTPFASRDSSYRRFPNVGGGDLVGRVSKQYTMSSLYWQARTRKDT